MVIRLPSIQKHSDPTGTIHYLHSGCVSNNEGHCIMRGVAFLFLILATIVVGCAPPPAVETADKTPLTGLLPPTAISSPVADMSESLIVTRHPTSAGMEGQAATATPPKATSPQETAPVSVTSELVLTPQRPTASSNPYFYMPVSKLTRDHYIESLSWESEGQGLVYALQGEWGLYVVPYVEPSQWNWWQYDVRTRQNTPLNPSGKSEIDLELRRKLGICALEPVEEDECGRVPLLWESPYGVHVIYNPVTRGENTWLAHKDGSNALELDEASSVVNVIWSSDSRWAVLSSSGFGAPGMDLYYLLDVNTGDIVHLGLLTGYNPSYVNYIRPRFSLDSQYLVFAAAETAAEEVQSRYGLYLLAMSTLESERLTDRFGPFQWEANSQSLYVLDNAILFEYANDMLAPREAALYNINIANRPFQETLLFDNINFFPQESPSAWHWAYSPEAQAIAIAGLQPEYELGILFLSPQ